MAPLTPHPHISDELLSAYLDNAVTDDERVLVEQSIQADPSIAWRLESLRQTVVLLRALPELALPRAFAIDEIIAAEHRAAAQPLTSQASLTKPQQEQMTATTPGWWQAWLAFWRGGNLGLRNAFATGLAVLAMLVVGPLALQRAGQLPTPAAESMAAAPASTEDLPPLTAAQLPQSAAVYPAPVLAESAQITDSQAEMASSAAVETQADAVTSQKVAASESPALSTDAAGGGESSRQSPDTGAAAAAAAPVAAAMAAPASALDTVLEESAVVASEAAGGEGQPAFANEAALDLPETSAASARIALTASTNMADGAISSDQAGADAAIAVTNVVAIDLATVEPQAAETQADGAQAAEPTLAQAASDESPTPAAAAMAQEAEGAEAAAAIVAPSPYPAPFLTRTATVLKVVQLAVAALTATFALFWWLSRRSGR